MTIGIGFHCADGVVLAADEQQTVEGYYKTHSRKIGILGYGGASISYTYAYLPNLTTVMEAGLRGKLPPFPPPLTLEIIADAISMQITEMKSQYPEEMKTQQFLYALSCGSGARLIRVSGGIVDQPQQGFIGIGDSSLVNYIFRNFTSGPPHMILHRDEALILAIYMVHLAKQFVDGVGGPTDAIFVPNVGPVDFVPRSTIEKLEAKFTDMHFILRDLYRILTDECLSKDDVDLLLSNLLNNVKGFREMSG